MRPHERLRLARAAYDRAVALARDESTPASWRRVLVASRNLGDAVRDRDRAAGVPRRERVAEGARRREGSVLSLTTRAGTPPRPPGALVLRAGTRPAAARRPVLGEEIARARALIAEALRLVERSRALSADLARLTGASPARRDPPPAMPE